MSALCLSPVSNEDSLSPRADLINTAPAPCLKGANKKYVCELEGCRQSFARPSGLEQHKRAHKNERPFACDYEDCNKRFLRASHLKVHRFSHAKVKPINCNVCGKGFSTKQQLSRHLNRHFPPNKCPYNGCSRVYFKKNHLSDHIVEYHLNGDILGPSLAPCEDEPTDKPFSDALPAEPQIFIKQEHIKHEPVISPASAISPHTIDALVPPNAISLSELGLVLSPPSLASHQESQSGIMSGTENSASPTMIPHDITPGSTVATKSEGSCSTADMFSDFIKTEEIKSPNGCLSPCQATSPHAGQCHTHQIHHSHQYHKIASPQREEPCLEYWQDCRCKEPECGATTYDNVFDLIAHYDLYHSYLPRSLIQFSYNPNWPARATEPWVEDNSDLFRFD